MQIKAQAFRLARNAIKDSFALFGLELRRAPEGSKFRRMYERSFRLGRFELVGFRDSPLPNLYRKYDGFAGHLARLALVLNSVYPEWRFLDVGANIGDSLAVVKNAVDCSAICIEGDKLCFDLLEENIKQFSGVTTYNLFLGEKTETVAMTLAQAGWNGMLNLKGNGTKTSGIQIVSLDDFVVDKPQFQNCKLVKIDAEGFDPKIIRGAQRFLESVKPVVVFEYNRKEMERLGEDGLSLFEFLIHLNYDTALFYDWVGRLLLATSLKNKPLIQHLHEYVDGRISFIPYFDVCVFNQIDQELANQFVISEESYRRNNFRQAAIHRAEVK